MNPNSMKTFRGATQSFAKGTAQISVHPQKLTAGQQSLQDLEQTHEESMQQMVPLIVSMASDPIAALPSELFTLCIQLALPLPEKGYTAALLQLTMVSRYWHKAILSDPALWTQITIDAYDEDSLATVATSLYLSRESMISLTVCPPMWDEWKPTFSLITSHSHRICQITLIATARSYEFQNLSSIIEGYLYCVALKKVLDLVGDLPSIISLDLGTKYALPIYLPDVTPLGLPPLALHNFHLPSTLQYMRRWTLQSPFLQTADSPIYGLRELHTEEPIDIFSHLMQDISQVECLTFTDRDWVFLYGNVPTQEHKTGQPRYTLPGLASLTYRQPSSNTVIALLPQVATNLRKLVLRISYGLVEFLIGALSTMAQLQNLDLAMTTLKWTGDLIPPATDRGGRAVPNLRSLTLRPYNRRMSLEEDESPTFCIQACRNLVSALVELYPDVTEGHIELSRVMNWAQVLPLLRNLNRLRYLSIDGSSQPQTAEGNASLAELEELLVEGDHILPCIICPNTIRLVHGGDSFRQLESFCQRCPALRSLTSSECFIYNHRPEGLNLTAFSHLTDLRVTLQEGDYTYEPQQMYLTSLPSLVRITLSGFDAVFGQATFLCLSLLYQPEMCPRLQELEFEGYPEWDSLFLMLEARNLSRNPSLSRISRITLSLIPYYLRSPLASLLRGESATRPSNEDLSIAATREVLFDANLSGCFMCLQSMLGPCNEPVTESEEWDTVPYSDTGYWAELPPSPLSPATSPEVSRWILDRPKRIRQWLESEKEWRLAHRRREMTCKWQETSGTITVTGHDV